MILTSFSGAEDDYENQGTNYWTLQGFQVLADANLESMTFLGSQGAAASGTFAFKVFEGSITGTEIYSETFNTSILTAFGVADTNTLTLAAPVPLVSGMQYYFTIQALTGSSSDEIRWVSTVGTVYPYGLYSFPAETLQTGRTKNFSLIGTGTGDPAVMSIQVDLIGYLIDA